MRNILFTPSFSNNYLTTDYNYSIKKCKKHIFNDTATTEIYTYRGTDKGEQVEYRFPTKLIQYLPVDIGGDIQIYDNYEVYQFYMDTKYLPIKFSTAGEYFYRLAHNQ